MKVGKRSVIMLFAGYVFAVTLAGLALHPYRSVRRMVFDKDKKILLPVSIGPSVALAGFFVIGRVGSYFLDFSGLYRELMAALLGWMLIGLLLWQGLILVLVYRFFRSR